MRDAADREPGAQTIVSDFRLERVIARSETALLYEARQLSEDRRVALKLVAPADGAHRERFTRQARAAMRFEHPNVVPVYGAGEADGRLFIAMRLIEGEDLERIIVSEGPLPPERVLGIVEQIAAGLDAAHASGLVHGDVKPGNVMVEQTDAGRERCYLVDFGLASDRDSPEVTNDGEWAGTPTYVSPEQLRGEPATARSDLYALGVLVFRALTGSAPFAREHDSGTLLAHLHAPPPSPTEVRPELPRAVNRVIARALAKLPEARYASAGELAADLAQALADPAPPPEAGTVTQTRPGNLPVESGSFVGRWAEIESLCEELTRSRLLSIVGPGGVGKTTLALHLVASIEREYAGAWMLELDAVRDTAGIELGLARALGLRIASPGELRAELIEFVGHRRLLLLLDGCEHLVDAAGQLVGELLAACPRLTAVVTSRERLAIEHEHVHHLAPLAVPAPDDDPADVLASDSAHLLLQRAAEHGAAVEPETASAAAIAGICARLEGIPLALELAAARLRTMSVDSLAQHLQEDLSVLRSHSANSLDGLIESSWRLLGADERSVLGRLAVFPATFTLDAARCVAGGDEGEPTGALAVRLADKSLLQVEATRGQTRLRMLQPVREFCLARMPASERLAARAAHRGHYLALVERARPMLDAAGAQEWLGVLDDDHVNVRAAVETGLEDGDPESSLRIGVAMRDYWACRGLAGEGIELLAAILRHAGLASRTALRAEAHSALAHLAAVGLGDTAAAERNAVEALQLARSIGDSDTTAEALTWLSWTASFGGDAAAAVALTEEGLSSAGSAGRPNVIGRLMDAQAMALEQLGEPDAARLAYEAARDLFAETGYATGVASVENHLGDLALSSGDLSGAGAHFSVARTTAEDSGDGASVAMAALNLALIDHLERRDEAASELFVDCLLTNQACGDRPNIAFSVFGLALTEPGPERAAELHGCASHRLAQLDIALSGLEQRLQTEELGRLRAALGDERFAAAFERGRPLLVEDIVAAEELAAG